MVWRRLPRMYLTYPVAHALVREDNRFCCADFRLYRYSEAPLRSQQTHTSHLCAKALLRKPSTREGLACALFSEKGIESRKASGRSKAEAPFLIVKRRFCPLRKRYRRIEKMPAHSSLLRPCKPCHVHLLPAGCTSRLPASLDLS
jgi:hypothetical protein